MKTTRPKPSDLSEGVTNHIDANEHLERATRADAGGDERGGAGTAGGGRRGGAEGAPATHRAPCNYNADGFGVLRCGVDSLYLSYPGLMADDWDHRLDALKKQAQSEDEREQALAQVVIGEHLFEVKDRGKGRFAYVLADNRYHIQASASSNKSLPLAYVQVSSEYLSAVGIEQAEASLRFIVNSLGLVEAPAKISRVDLFVDYVADLAMDAFDPLRDWVTRSQSIDLHYRYKQFSGWSIGMGGEVSARLYDKTLEIEKKSHKFYLHDLWRATGWDGERKVWRLEFQARREVLVSLGVVGMNDLVFKQTGLWGYLTGAWLRLAVPSDTDSNQTRWPNHPLWNLLATAFNEGIDQPMLGRFRSVNLPSDERLFVHGLGGITSFMAREGITELDEGIGEFLHQAQVFHDIRHPSVGKGFGAYIGKKVKVKNRRYNTVNNRKNTHADKQEVKRRAQAYRGAKDGEDGDA